MVKVNVYIKGPLRPQVPDGRKDHRDPVCWHCWRFAWAVLGLQLCQLGGGLLLHLLLWKKKAVIKEC